MLLLHDAGLIDGTVFRPISGLPDVTVFGLTWAGHDFLGAVSSDSVWAKAKSTVLAPAAGATWAVILEWLKAESLKALGVS